MSKQKSSYSSSGKEKIRRASHAGSWYTDNKDRLNSQLSQWLATAKPTHFPARAIIAPHAGYDYCGPCAGHAYKQIDPSKINRVFILGPSHHFSLGENCALSIADSYETPLYNLAIDKDVYRQLRETNQFEELTMKRDEDEHSLEMHLPYVAKIMESRAGLFTIVPIMVGALSPHREAFYGRMLAPYLADPHNFFVISSDFCHWGKRFDYTHYDKNDGAIWQSIEALDRKGMDCIETLDPPVFTNYLRKYSNTICGRHPIGVLLNSVATLREQNTNGQKLDLKFVQYAQSSKCQSFSDSSVSYASAALLIQQ